MKMKTKTDKCCDTDCGPRPRDLRKPKVSGPIFPASSGEKPKAPKTTKPKK